MSCIFKKLENIAKLRHGIETHRLRTVQETGKQIKCRVWDHENLIVNINSQRPNV